MYHLMYHAIMCFCNELKVWSLTFISVYRAWCILGWKCMMADLIAPTGIYTNHVDFQTLLQVSPSRMARSSAYKRLWSDKLPSLTPSFFEHLCMWLVWSRYFLIFLGHEYIYACALLLLEKLMPPSSKSAPMVSLVYWHHVSRYQQSLLKNPQAPSSARSLAN